jgi:DNA-binding IclR family transcriptional regulator
MKWRPHRLRLRRRRTVLDALAQVGKAGMTPNSLEVTTDIPEPLLNATLVDLIEAGLVTQRVDDSLLTARRDLHYLLSDQKLSEQNENHR